MDVLEALVRDTLAEHADDAPPADGLLEAVIARPRRRAGWLVLGAAAAVVLLVVGLSAALSRGHRSHSLAARRPHRPESSHVVNSPLRLPDKTVAYHGVVVTVPGNLPVLTIACALPASYVLADDPNESVSCPTAGVPAGRRVVTVTLETGRGLGGIVKRTAPASGTAFVQDAGVIVTVTAPAMPVVKRILGSVRLAADPNGCPARTATVSNPPSRHLVAGHPDSLVRCVYATGGWLQASIPLRPASLVAQRINSLRAGDALPTRGGWYGHELLRFGYGDGTARFIRVSLGSPSLFSDGSRVVGDVGNRVVDLLDRLSR